jgi:hypothetical protein
MAKISRAERKLAMREEAKRQVGGSKYARSNQKNYGEDVEKGRKELLVKSAEGGDSKAKKVKGELSYLLNNYLPTYDTRIEMLIEEWRRSSDPSYDPGIRIRYRRAKQEHMRDANPY